MVFGYALLEEVRPKKEFWTVVRFYTIIILMFKFTLNMTMFADFLQSDGFKKYSGFIKIGIYDYKEMDKLVVYMMPEILIICAIILNEIKLKLISLYYMRESDVETVLEGIQRNLKNGDEEEVEKMKF